MDALLVPVYGFFDALLPFAWARPVFMKNALLALVLIAPSAALVGIHLTSFRMAFFSDAISHSAFTGVALGFLFSVNPSLSMALFAVGVAVLIHLVERYSRVAMDNIISVIMSAGVAAGLCIVSFRKSFMRDFQSYLFGDILTVTGAEIAVMAVVLFLVMAWSYFRYNRLALEALSPLLSAVRTGSRAGRGRRTPDKLVFSLICAVLIAVGIKVTGMLLITSLLVIPPVTARLVARGEGRIFWLALAVTEALSVTALVLSYYWDMAVGGLIVAFLSALFFAATVLKAVWKVRI